MKTLKPVWAIACIFLFIIAVSGPFFKFNDISLSLISIKSVAPQMAFFVPLSILFSINIFYIFIKNNITKFLMFFITLFCSIFFLFSSLIMKLFGYSLELDILPIMISLISMFEFIYSSSIIFNDLSLTTQDIIEMAMFVGASIVLDLSFFKFKVVPNGGSISLAMLPLMILSLRKGFSKGLIGAGIVYGLINCLTDGYGIFTYPFDYFLGFGSVSILGMMRKLIVSDNGKAKFSNYFFLTAGVLIVLLTRTLSSTISGMIFYRLSFVPSLIYQLTYIPGAVLICFCVLLFLLKPLCILEKKIFKKNII